MQQNDVLSSCITTQIVNLNLYLIFKQFNDQIELYNEISKNVTCILTYMHEKQMK